MTPIITDDTPVPDYCPLPNAHRSLSFSPAATVAETIERHTPIRVCAIGDDYDTVNNQDWLSAPGGFR